MATHAALAASKFLRRTEVKHHLVADADRERIECVCGCGKRADVCVHSRWNTGAVSGISFWYYAAACVPRGKR